MGSPKQPSTNSSSESWPSLFISRNLNVILAFSRGSNSGSLSSSSSASNLEPVCYTTVSSKSTWPVMPGSIHIFIYNFCQTYLPKIGCEIFISMCSVLPCSVKKVNKLLCNILVTSLPKTTKSQVTKMGWNAH
jgi:hypothetical protein